MRCHEPIAVRDVYQWIAYREPSGRSQVTGHHIVRTPMSSGMSRTFTSSIGAPTAYRTPHEWSRVATHVAGSISVRTPSTSTQPAAVPAWW